MKTITYSTFLEILKYNNLELAKKSFEILDPNEKNVDFNLITLLTNNTLDNEIIFFLVKSFIQTTCLGYLIFSQNSFLERVFMNDVPLKNKNMDRNKLLLMLEKDETTKYLINDLLTLPYFFYFLCRKQHKIVDFILERTKFLNDPLIRKILVPVCIITKNDKMVKQLLKSENYPLVERITMTYVDRKMLDIFSYDNETKKNCSTISLKRGKRSNRADFTKIENKKLEPLQMSILIHDGTFLEQSISLMKIWMKI